MHFVFRECGLGWQHRHKCFPFQWGNRARSKLICSMLSPFSCPQSEWKLLQHSVGIYELFVWLFNEPKGVGMFRKFRYPWCMVTLGILHAFFRTKLCDSSYDLFENSLVWHVRIVLLSPLCCIPPVLPRIIPYSCRLYCERSRMCSSHDAKNGKNFSWL